MRGRESTRAGFVLVAAVVVLAGAACGGSDAVSKDEYEARMRPIVLSLSARLDRMNSILGDPTRMGEFERELAHGRRTLQDAARRLAAIGPPGDVGRMHEGMATGARQYARELEPLQAAARCRDRDAFELAEARQSGAGFVALASGIRAIRARGYRIPNLVLRGDPPPRRAVPARPLGHDCGKRA